MRNKSGKKTAAIPVPRIVSLNGACRHYHINDTTIRATIAKYEDFPVLERAQGIGKAWKFDLNQIDEWLNINNDFYRGEREAAGRPPKKNPDGVATVRAEQKNRENKSVVQTELLKLELDKKRGLLVEREEVVQMLSANMSRFAKQLELLPNLIGKKLGFTDEAIRLFRDHLDEARRALVKNDQGYFAQMDEGGA